MRVVGFGDFSIRGWGMQCFRVSGFRVSGFRWAYGFRFGFVILAVGVRVQGFARV